MIVPRLVLGTARIAGGVSEGQALAMVKSAFDSGICAVDTAPSYGLGTAEEVVGKALAGHPRVEVATKLGSHRPGLALLRTLARGIKRLASSPGEPKPYLPPARIEAPTGNDFSARFMAQSFEISQEKLGRIDALLLHDISAGEVTSAVLDDLERLGRGRTTGYAGYARWDLQLDQCFKPQMTAQCAPDPGWLLGTVSSPRDRPLQLHSIAKTGLALASENPMFASSLERTASMIETDPLTARIAAIYALASVRIPEARLLLTSSHQARLERLTKALQKVDEQHTASAIAAQFVTQAG
jgi:hypothetical protein